MYQLFLSSFSAEVHTAKSSHFHNKINSAPDMRNLFRTFNYLLCPPSPPPTTSITADDFAFFFLQTKLKQSVVSFHLHSYRTPNQLDPLLKLPSSPSVPSLRRKYPNFSSPAILQHVELSSNELSSTRSHCFFHRTTNWTLNSQVSGVAIQLRLRYSQSLKPCELQKPIPNHQSSFCLICLPLLTLSIIRSSCPPSHHWTSLGFHFADDTQLYLSFRPDDPTVAARISGCLADISAWMKEHHLQLNLAKTELLVFPATPTLQHDFTIQLGSSTITPSALVRNLGAIFDDQLTFK